MDIETYVHNTPKTCDSLHAALYVTLDTVTTGQAAYWLGSANARLSTLQLAALPAITRQFITAIAPRLARYFDAGRILDLAKYHDLTMDFSEEGYIDFNFDNQFSITAKVIKPILDNRHQYQTRYTTGKPFSKITTCNALVHRDLVKSVIQEFWLDALAANDGWSHTKSDQYVGLSYVVPYGDFDIEWQLTFDRENYTIWTGL